MSDGASDKRHSIAASICPAEWDNRPASIADELLTFLGAIKDQGTSIDSGRGCGYGDLWVTVQGVEYYVSIRKSNNQLVKEGQRAPDGDTLSP